MFNRCSFVDRLKKIIKIAKKLKIKTPYLRPKFLSEDNSPVYKVIHHLINYYKKKKIYYDYINLLQCSSPLEQTIILMKQ